MKISQLLETTTAGAIASVAQPMGTQTRSGKKAGSMFNGKKTSKPFYESDLQEDDIIVVPGQGRIKKSGFVKHDPDRAEHEGETLKNSLRTIIRVATHLDKRLSLQSEFPEWVSEKIGAVKSNMVTVMDYLISSQEMQHNPDAMEEGAKVDRMVKHIAKTEKKLGHSKKEAENIGWATANKRGYLDK